MYLFLPRHFFIKNSDISAATNLCPGVRFSSNEGHWTTYQIYGSHLGRIHWFHVLYGNKDKISAENHSNAVVYHENNKIIFEITREVEEGSIIRAKFHPNISLEHLLFDTFPHGIHFTSSEPLDLSIKKDDYNSKRKLIRKKHMLPCQVCNKNFDRPSLLKRHVRTHTGERPHVCEICAKGFSTSSSLNTHKRIHSGERPHQCTLCGKRFTASSNLYYHRLTHSLEKPHKCDICGKSFPTPGNLRSHKYSHGSSSPYKCNVCFRIFTKLSNLKNHRNLQKHN